MSREDYYQIVDYGKHMERKWLLCLLGAVFMGLVAGCILQTVRRRADKSCTRQIFAMDTVMSFTAYGQNSEKAVAAAIREVERLDALLAASGVESEIARLNETGVLPLSEDALALFERARSVYDMTEGLFDITIYPLIKLWGFSTREYHVPSNEELAQVLPLVDASQITLSEGEARLGKGQQADLGGIAKGYTSDRIMEIYKKYGIRSGMVTLGGNVQVLNKKPDGSKWRVGIRDPKGGPSDIITVLNVENEAVVTSGGYERYFEEDGNTYIHILDPRTGYPVKGDLASVTVVSEDGTLADALSTALYVMGTTDALNYWKNYGENFELVLIMETGEIYATEGLKGCMEAQKIMFVGREGKGYN